MKLKHTNFGKYLIDEIKKNVNGIFPDNLKMEIPNVLSIYMLIDKTMHKFVLDIVKGMFYIDDQVDANVSDEFDNYAGVEMRMGNNSMEYHIDPVRYNSSTWIAIKRTDALLTLSKTMAYLDLLNHYSIRLLESESSKFIGCITRKGIEKIKFIYDENLSSICRIKNSGDYTEYMVAAYPNYMDIKHQSVVIYTHIGYPKDDYIGNFNTEFFLTIDPVRETCFYSADFPWVSKRVNIFTCLPGEIDSIGEDLRSAIMLIADRIFSMFEHNSRSVTELYVAHEKDSGLMTNKKIAEEFVSALASKIVMEYAPSDNNDDIQNAIAFSTHFDGITRIMIGSVVLDVAIDYCGLVDIGTIREINTDHTWSDIFYKKQVADDFVITKKPLKELCIVYEDSSESGKLVMEDMGNIVSELMIQKDQKNEK